MSEKKESKKQEKMPVEKLISDAKENKYLTIAKCIKRSRELVKSNEEKRSLREIITKAIDDVYTK